MDQDAQDDLGRTARLLPAELLGALPGGIREALSGPGVGPALAAQAVQALLPALLQVPTQGPLTEAAAAAAGHLPLLLGLLAQDGDLLPPLQVAMQYGRNEAIAEEGALLLPVVLVQSATSP